MVYNFTNLGAPVIGIKNPDGTQTIAVKDRHNVYRTYVSTPEKIDEFIKTTKKGEKSENMKLAGGAILGLAAGIISGIILKKKIPNTAFDPVVNACLAIPIGLLAGALSGPLTSRKKVENTVAKLTEGVPQEKQQTAQNPTPATTGFNNLLKQAQSQQT